MNALLGRMKGLVVMVVWEGGSLKRSFEVESYRDLGVCAHLAIHIA